MASRPRAFRLDDPGVVTRPAAGAAPLRDTAAAVVVTEEPDEAIAAADGVPVIPARRRRAPLATIFAGAVGGLVSLGVGVAVERLVADLFAREPWLGWVALVLAAAAALALLGIVAREIGGVLRERRIERLRADAADAIAVRDAARAKTIAREVAALYAGRLTGPGPQVAEVDGEIMDADDRLALAERTLLAPIDAAAQRAVAATARQVSLVTALSPRAVVDLVFVVYAAARLLARIARLYGGQPGAFGYLRLARAAFNHLVVTGGVAVGDGILQSALGLGLAARVSARLGEGAVNGLMTARFGLAAIEVCRPLPFIRETPPRLGDVAGDLLARAGETGSTKP